MKKIAIIIMIIFATLLISQTRKPAVSGTWYPSNKNELNKMLEDFYQKVDLEKEQENIEPFGIVSPHAGFIYSGQIAAYGYSLLKNKHFDTVILLGPSHHYLENVISIYNGDFYKTPLGNVPIDRELASILIKKDKKFVFLNEIHEQEHSLEAQVPFLQYQMKDFKIVPILTSTRDFKLLDKMANILIEIIENTKKKILVVSSTDMSHFHNYQKACAIDRGTIDLILEKKWDVLKNNILSERCELCGYYSFYIFQKVMEHFQDGDGILLKYANSGDAMGDTNSNRVVGYCSIVFPKKGEEKMEKFTLSKDEEKYLLNLARTSIEYYLENRKKYVPPKPDAGIMNRNLAVFVTLNKNDNLRGCIGQLIAQGPLYLAVSEMANSAAFNDYRFGPVSKDELEDINIEISILTPPERIFDIEKIRMGIDGVWIKKGFRSGVFLPQVATETGWDRKTFLENLCAHKAGLPKDAYLDKDTEVNIFQVYKFKE
ncbi:MAG TPA: AmmeMemoRadiSam system protein B [Candidatus Cloacimonetes bacterium]|nr:AmmeMemoRadiSam system protein B [Candidatus Cloacimonadota bacterium]